MMQQETNQADICWDVSAEAQVAALCDTMECKVPRGEAYRCESSAPGWPASLAAACSCSNLSISEPTTMDSCFQSISPDPAHAYMLP